MCYAFFLGSCNWGKGQYFPVFEVDEEFDMLNGCYACKYNDQCKMTCSRTAKAEKECEFDKGRFFFYPLLHLL